MGGEIIPGESQFKVIIAEIRHLGDQPTSVGEAGIFVGPLFHAKFELPDSVDPLELAVIQCRTKHNQLNNKMFFLNNKPLPDILEPHPKNKNEWMMDLAIVPKGWLRPGENSIHIGYADERYDDFVVDNLVLWYKKKPKGARMVDRGDVDSLDHLSDLQEGTISESDKEE